MSSYHMIIKFSFPADITMNSKKQVLTQYKSGLPDFLLTFVDSIIKSDRSQILRYNFLHYTIDELLRQDVPRQDTVCVFFDPDGLKHIFFENIKNHSNQIPFRTAQTFVTSEWNSMTQQDEQKVKYPINPLFLKYFTNTELQKWSELKTITIDQVRCRCQANVYSDPEDVVKQILKVISWNQIFRSKSANSFIYLTILLENITSIINKKKFHKKFLHYKKKDFQKLLTYEIKYKFNANVWPYVPEKFRQYQQIDDYVPTPQKRSDFIQKRLLTKKNPVECPQNCVCYSDLPEDQSFCKHTLKDGWVTQCPNRVNKIQCNHSDPIKMSKCRNAQIKKCQRKKCKKNDQDNDSNNEIQQCIMWGIDYYTRNIIYHCLPEVDFEVDHVFQNKDCKNKFIEETLLKAINFNGSYGYSLESACAYIFQYKHQKQTLYSQQKQPQKQGQKLEGLIWKISTLKQSQNIKQNSEGQLFTQKDILYASVLLSKYRYCYQNVDKTAFRIHTKGKGARCVKKQGIKQGNFIVQYYGQLYQPWRWYQRQDFIKQIMKKKKLKNYIPQFYNIYLQHHKDDPQGYDLMVVDPNKKGNFSSRFSHSCNPNCGTVTTISDGKYYIGMYSFRDIKYGQELTFDYCCMTQSSYQHTHSICLCGTQKCRGNYLQLANSRTFSQLVDKNTCFLSRNSLILQALQPVTQQDYDLCAQFNIKDRMLSDSPDWIIKWTAKLLKFIESQLKMYKSQLVQKWTKDYPWQQTTPEIQAANIELYSQTSKNDLYALRFQNLFTTLDKLKYFLNANPEDSKQSPLYYLQESQLIQFLIGSKQGKNNKEAILTEIEEVLIHKQKINQSMLVKKFRTCIQNTKDYNLKLFYFRACCLCVSHMCLFIKPTPQFNSHLFGDIVYFYAFTHTYFTAKQYKPQVSEELKVTLMEITGKPTDAKIIEKQKRRYNAQFVWGQLVSWYKQTIVSPQASLSQDRRGTLSYPMIKSTLESCYPFQKYCRSGFLKALKDKSANSWPCAPNQGCFLSFKNPFKCYGTVFFESVHNAKLFKDFPYENLLDNVLNNINNRFIEKLQLFKKVETVVSKIGELDEVYSVFDHIEAKFFSFNQNIPVQFPPGIQQSKPKKKKKNLRDQ